MRPEHRTYIPEIDGLRGVAVISVLLFHLGFDSLSGGYVGVDIFFVISGYLITRNIVDDISLDKFSFSGFYYRRARRLFPALLFTIAVSAVFSVLIFSPEHLKRFSDSLIYAVLSVSNFYFWGEAGYFDISSSFKPLLHLWSLAVEEQFYLIWPATLVLLFSVTKPRFILTGLLLLGVISIIAAEYVMRKDPAAAFYLTPFRIIEFSIGAACVWCIQYRAKNWQYEAGMITGLAIITYTVIFFNKDTAFPGFNSLAPCLGAALIILSNKARSTGILLRNKLIVRTGLISYSLYLIHWPILTFYTYWTFRPPGIPERFILMIISFILAEFMYRYIEQAFRLKSGNKKQTPAPQFFGACTLIVIVLLIPAVHAKNNDGWTWRTAGDSLSDEEVSGFRCRDNKTSKHGTRCTAGIIKNGASNILLIGDSHAEQLITAMDYLGKKNNLKVDVWMLPGCPPIWGTYKIYGESDRKERQETCKTVVSLWEKEISSGKYDYIVLAGRWMWLFEPARYGTKDLRRDFLVDRNNPVLDESVSRELFHSRLKRTIEEIHNNGGKAIVFSQVPLLARNVQHCNKVPKVLKKSMKNRCHGNISYQEAINRLTYTNETIRQLSSETTMSVIPSDYICDPVNNICNTILDGTLIYHDHTHLNKKGSLLIAKQIEAEFSKFTNQR